MRFQHDESIGNTHRACTTQHLSSLMGLIYYGPAWIPACSLSRTLSSQPPTTYASYLRSPSQRQRAIPTFPAFWQSEDPMKQLLRDRELLNVILEFVLDTQYGRRSVSRLARTCRALSEPCLNALWKELDSLLPLLSLLPNDLFKRPRRPGLGFVSIITAYCDFLTQNLAAGEEPGAGRLEASSCVRRTCSEDHVQRNRRQYIYFDFQRSRRLQTARVHSP